MPGPLYEREAHWVRQEGTGVIWTGPCYVLHVLFHPDAGGDHVVLYDGVDALSGRVFHDLEAATATTLEVSFGEGVRFEQGIYVNMVDNSIKVTVVFQPVVRGSD